MTDEISRWVRGLADGDELAAQRLWEQYFERLVRMARKKLGGANRRMADEEDVALSAFHSLCRGAAAGRFPKLDDRDDLWKLLATITARKAIAQQRRAGRQKRGGGAVRGESVFEPGGCSERNPGIGGVLGNEPTPELAAQMNERCAALLECLHDESLRRIALFKLENYNNQEIADELGCTLRTVEKKLTRIRQAWAKAPDSE